VHYFGDNMPISQNELANQNPWWQNKNAIEDDFKIKQFKASQIQYIHPLVKNKYKPFCNRSQVPGSPFPVIVVFHIFIDLLRIALNSSALI